MRERSDKEIALGGLGWLTSNIRQMHDVLAEALQDEPQRRVLLATCCAGFVGSILLSVRHETVRAPPPTVNFAGLPVSGTLADAQRAGFNDCFATDAVHLRCRRHATQILNTGPYEAAVDLEGSDGQGGFDQIVIWHDRDNYAVFQIADTLERAGWTYCYTGDGRWADQAIYTRLGSPIRASLDISFYSKRRIRIITRLEHQEDNCFR